MSPLKDSEYEENLRREHPFPWRSVEVAKTGEVKVLDANKREVKLFTLLVFVEYTTRL